MKYRTMAAFGIGVAGFSASAVGFRRFFDRDPERAIPEGDCILAPADGRILEIVSLDNSGEAVIDKGILGRIRTVTADLGDEPLLLISIFMSPLVVHVQRAPAPGRVVSVTHRDGRLTVTNTLRALDNERAETIIESPVGRIKVIQIAGVMARRIETWVSEGQDLSAGDRMGRIRLGSQVSLILPVSDRLAVTAQRGDRVTAGETILATFGRIQ